jgi:hypothetical protein
MAKVLWLSSCLALAAYGAGCASDPEDKGDGDGKTSGSGSGGKSSGASGSSGSDTDAGADGPQSGSGGASASGSGGSGASAAVDCDALALPDDEDDVIATFEDGVGNVVQTETRGGGFYMYNDGTGTQEPPVGALPDARREKRCESAFALCMKGEGFTDWGAGMGTDLGRTAPLDAGTMVVDAGTIADGGVGSKNPYDASEYKGISFWAKSNAAPVLLRVNFKDKNTAPEGGVCDPKSESGATACNDDWGKNINLTTSWAPFTILFGEIKQSGWGAAYKAFDAENAYALQFQVNKGIDFDLCIDDLAFVR